MVLAAVSPPLPGHFRFLTPRMIGFQADAAWRTRYLGPGWDLAWSYKNLVTACQIGIVMPEKAQPGPLAGEISSFAPVSLFFFFFVMLLVTTIRRIDLHPVNYFFLAAACSPTTVTTGHAPASRRR